MNALVAQLSILGPAFAAGLLVLATHVPLGRIVLARGIIFIDLAVAQIAGLGVIAAQALGWESHGLAVQAVAAGSAVAGGLLLHWTERRWPEVQEALIGVAFVLAASGGLLLLAGNPHAGEHLKELLAGQILWADWNQLGIVAALYAVLLALWLGARGRPGQLQFYLTFALAVTVSVQLVGVYLVFASLILPALAVRHRAGRHAVAVGVGLGALGYLAGLALSALLDLPAGPAVAWALAAATLPSGLIRSRPLQPAIARADRKKL